MTKMKWPTKKTLSTSAETAKDCRRPGLNVRQQSETRIEGQTAVGDQD